MMNWPSVKKVEVTLSLERSRVDPLGVLIVMRSDGPLAEKVTRVMRESTGTSKEAEPPDVPVLVKLPWTLRTSRLLAVDYLGLVRLRTG